jgi:hypothetical protein
VSINKNFVVKHGLEVSTDLILANADTRRVGIASTNPRYTLEVNGGIGATDVYITGIGTFQSKLNVGLGGTYLSVGSSIGIGTSLPEYLVDIRSPVSTGQTALYVQGDVRITGDLNLDDAEIQDLTVTDTLFVAGLSAFSSNVFINAGLNVSGVTTLGGYADINNSVDISNDLNVVGLTTLGGYVDINNSVDISNDLNVTGISTLATVNINAGEIDVSRIETGDLSVTGITTLGTVQVSSGIVTATAFYGDGSNLTGIATAGGDTILGFATVTELNVTGIASLTNLTVSGVSTFGNIVLDPVGIITAVSGIVTYYGDGQYLQNITSGIGIGTTGGVVGYGITFIDFYGAGVSTTFYDGSVGIATIFFEGGGGAGTIGIGLTFPDSATNGDLFFSAEFGRLFVYYDEVVIGVGLSAFWIDAAPFNINLAQLDDLQVNNLVVINNSNLNNLNVTGITTVSNLIVGNVNSSGIVTSVSVSTGDINSSGIITAIDFNSTSDLNLKYNVETVENALDTVNSLRGVSFNWKEDDRKSYGVIAQELEKVLPDLVSNGEIKTVNYNGIIGVLIEAVKELKKEIEELKNN